MIDRTNLTAVGRNRRHGRSPGHVTTPRRRGAHSSHACFHAKLGPSASAAADHNLFSYASYVNLNPRDRNGDPGGIACMQAQTMHCTRLMLVASKGRCVLNHDDDSRLNQPAILMWQTDGRKALAWRNRNLSSQSGWTNRATHSTFSWGGIFQWTAQQKEMYGNPPDRRCASLNSQLVRNPIMTHQVLLFYLVT